MSNRELFKILKKLKLFSTFYLACAQAWEDANHFESPRDNLRDYFDRTAKPLMENQREMYIDGIRKWNIKPPIKLI
jgi:hypothetical protein